jgi:hypothetical protein
MVYWEPMKCVFICFSSSCPSSLNAGNGSPKPQLHCRLQNNSMHDLLRGLPTSSGLLTFQDWVSFWKLPCIGKFLPFLIVNYYALIAWYEQQMFMFGSVMINKSHTYYNNVLIQNRKTKKTKLFCLILLRVIFFTLLFWITPLFE